jgi:hypothetical protein
MSFWTLQCSRPLVDVCGCGAIPPRPPTSAASASRRRRLGGRWRRDYAATAGPPASAGSPATPAAAAVGIGVGGATPPLPPTRTSVPRLCNLRRLGSGPARADGCPVAPPPCVLNIKVDDQTPLLSKNCAPLHFNRNSAANWPGPPPMYIPSFSRVQSGKNNINTLESFHSE